MNLSIPLPAGPVSSAPCCFMLTAEDVTVSTMKLPAFKTHLSTHHLCFNRKWANMLKAIWVKLCSQSESVFWHWKTSSVGDQGFQKTPLQCKSWWEDSLKCRSPISSGTHSLGMEFSTASYGQHKFTEIEHWDVFMSIFSRCMILVRYELGKTTKDEDGLWQGAAQ